jgi:hypothetical protein
MAILDVFLGTTNVTFFYVILIWVLYDSLRLSKSNNLLHFKHTPTIFAYITVFFSAFISIFNVAFVFYDYVTHDGIIGFNFVSLVLTWVLATFVSFYSIKNTLKESKRFPFVLILWWVFVTFVDIISLALKLIKNYDSMMNFWILLLEEENIVDVVSLPMLLVLCFNALPNVCVKEQSEIEQRLLQKEFESSTLGDESEEAFVKASLWSKLTFRWLNPIFEIGRIQKLEHVHVPSVPQSETAASASSMLEESIRKQKLQGGSLTKAIVHSVWKSLALNAVLAGTLLY